MSRIRFVAFDLDGTLLQGGTVCEAIARQLGHLDRMRELERLTKNEEIEAARAELAGYYESVSQVELLECLKSLTIAPGAGEAIRFLRQKQIKTAIISITWEFAAEYFAQQLGVDFFVGTRLEENGQIVHFWPEDKGTWLSETANRIGVDLRETAAVGDSWGDVHLLKRAGCSVFVGPVKPEGLENVFHAPNGDILQIVQEIIAGEGSVNVDRKSPEPANSIHHRN